MGKSCSISSRNWGQLRHRKVNTAFKHQIICWKVVNLAEIPFANYFFLADYLFEWTATLEYRQIIIPDFNSYV